MAECLHVPGVAEVDAALIGALVAAVLQTDHGLSGAQLLLGEHSLILLSFLRSNAWFPVLRHLQKISDIRV